MSIVNIINIIGTEQYIMYVRSEIQTLNTNFLTIDIYIL